MPGLLTQWQRASRVGPIFGERCPFQTERPFRPPTPRPRPRIDVAAVPVPFPGSRRSTESIHCRYTARQDRWVFGDRDSGAYLPKFA
jgi:hypothetical protein